MKNLTNTLKVMVTGASFLTLLSMPFESAEAQTRYFPRERYNVDHERDICKYNNRIKNPRHFRKKLDKDVTCVQNAHIKKGYSREDYLKREKKENYCLGVEQRNYDRYMRNKR